MQAEERIKSAVSDMAESVVSKNTRGYKKPNKDVTHIDTCIVCVLWTS